MFKKILSALLLTLALSANAGEIPVDAKLDYNQGIDFYKLGMYEKSIESFRSAVKAYPDYVDAYFNLGAVLEYMKQYAEAICVYKQVYVRNPNDYEVIYKLANLSSKIEDYKSATEYLKLIPQSSAYYKRATELAESLKISTTVPEKQFNEHSNIASKSGIYENIVSPTGITTDIMGNVYVSCFSDNAIIKITPSGKRKVFLKSSMINGPISLASDSIGNIYVSNYNANNVLKITPRGDLSVFVTNVNKPYGLHVNGDMLFITCQGSNSILRQKIAR